MAQPTGLPVLRPGYAREWIAVEALIQARLITYSSLSANLLVSTTFGPEQWTPSLTASPTLYFLLWNYSPGLTTDQMQRLKVALVAHTLDDPGGMQDPAEVSVVAVTTRLTFQDVLVTPAAFLPPPPPPAVDTIIVLVESDPEVFSCGSLGDCGAPQGKIVAQVTVTNPDSVHPATVNFVADGSLYIRISDDVGTPYSLSQSINANTTITFWIYGWIGDQTDLFPVDPEEGGILVTLISSASVLVDQISVPWYYIGL